MCGRYTLTDDLAELEKLAQFICKISEFKARYNIAPRSIVPVLVWEGDGFEDLASSGRVKARYVKCWRSDETGVRLDS